MSHVETRVLSGELKVGDRPPGERELVTQFQVGRSTVRKAIRVLESDGLVASPPGRSTRCSGA